MLGQYACGAHVSEHLRAKFSWQAFKSALPCRAAKAALYHGESCSSLVSAAEELQAVLLSGRIAHLRPGFLLEYEIILQEALCIFKCFSSRYNCLNSC